MKTYQKYYVEEDDREGTERSDKKIRAIWRLCWK
jgi:hypothetical protein